MISVFPVDADQVQYALGAVAGQADVCIQLSDRHFVLGGEPGAVRAAAGWLEEEAYAQSRVIDPALPMHSRMFKPAADAFGAALEQVEWTPAEQPYLPNVDGTFLTNVKRSDYVDRLYRHVFNTVRWSQSLAEVVQHFPDAAFVEVGPKCVLYNAFRREYKDLRCFCTDDPDSENPTLPATVQRLREIHNAA
jgi:malonyl CoA-acyl carrier protein transacylase